MKLLTRTVPIAGESWPGYLLRLAEANFIDSIQSLARQCGMKLSEILIHDPRGVLRLLSIDVNGFAIEDEPPPLSAKSRRLQFFGRTIRSRVCPQCMGEMAVPYVRAEWDRALNWSCGIHNRALLECCTRCATPIDHLRAHVAHCRCGLPFAAMAAPDVPWWEMSVLRPLGLENRHGTRALMFERSSPVEVAAAKLLMQMLKYTRREESKRCTIRALYTDSFVPQAVITEILPWFDRWPAGFKVQFVLAKEKARSEEKRSRNDFISAADFPVVKAAIGELAQHQMRSPKPKRIHDGDTVGLKYIMQHTGCHSFNVLRWIERGVFGTVQSIQLPSGFTSYRIPQEIARQVIEVVRQTSSAKELANALGCDANVLRWIAQAGAIQQLDIYGRAAHSKRLRTDEAYAFAQRLLRAAAMKHRMPTCAITFPRTVQWMRSSSRADVAALLDAIFAGRLELIAFRKDVVRLDELFLDRDEVKKWSMNASGSVR